MGITYTALPPCDNDHGEIATMRIRCHRITGFNWRNVCDRCATTASIRWNKLGWGHRVMPLMVTRTLPIQQGDA